MADRQADFVRLLTQHSSRIFGFVLGLCVNRTDAEDVFQNTSVVLWEKFDSFEPGSNFLAWACRIAYFEVLYDRRKSARVKTLSDAAWQALAADALTAADQKDDHRETLAACLDKLAAADRELLEQKYFSQRSVAEIADRCSRSVHSVYRALSRIHDALLECMRRAMSAG
jgi:RNA polymerase sigma-70 factor (ECF subfamily)